MCIRDRSWDMWQFEHGAFSYWLLQSFAEVGSVDADGNNEVSAEEVYAYIEPHLVSHSYTLESSGYAGPQHPQLYDGHEGELVVMGIDLGFPPLVTTDLASPVGVDSATLNAVLDDLGSASSVEVWFEWGLDTSYGNETGRTIMTSRGPFSMDLSNLAPGTAYHFRARACGHGEAIGGDAHFTTLSHHCL